MLRCISALVLLVAASAEGESPRVLAEKKVRSFKVCTAPGDYNDSPVALSDGKKIYKCDRYNKPILNKPLGDTDYICYPGGEARDYTCQQSYYFKDGALKTHFKEMIVFNPKGDMYKGSYYTFEGLEKWKNEAKDLKDIKYTVTDDVTYTEMYEFMYKSKGYDFTANDWERERDD